MWGQRPRNTQEAKGQMDFRGAGAASVWKVTKKRRDGRPCGETAGLMFLVGKIKPAGKIPLEDIWDYIPFHSVLILRSEQEWDGFYKRALRSLKLEMLKHRMKECLARALWRKPMQLQVVNMAPGNCSLKGLFSFFTSARERGRTHCLWKDWHSQEGVISLSKDAARVSWFRHHRTVSRTVRKFSTESCPWQFPKWLWSIKCQLQGDTKNSQV